MDQTVLLYAKSLLSATLDTYLGIKRLPKPAPILAFILIAARPSKVINRSCAESSGSEPDRIIQGRLAVYNGGYPNFRLWEIGSRHLYSIYGNGKDAGVGPGDREEETQVLPKNVDDAFAGKDVVRVKVFGKFVIRPLEGFKAGSMQAACIVSANRLVRKVD